MKIKLVPPDAEVLRFRARIIYEKDKSKLVPLASNLLNFMHKHKGLGLAAPQIGRSIRLFVMNVPGPGGIFGKERICVNPSFTAATGLYESAIEGCLSLPGVFRNIDRLKTIYVRYYDLNDNVVNETLSGLEARVFQHEHDHLQGRLITDH
jgi:peptide deformylase